MVPERIETALRFISLFRFVASREAAWMWAKLCSGVSAEPERVTVDGSIRPL
jgi:hypothetical protein